MLELARIQSDAVVDANWAKPRPHSLVLGLARTNEELEAIQRLRYNVFTEEMHAVFPNAADGLDTDRYDPWCEHLMVRETGSGMVGGTSRLLRPEHARKGGGEYSAPDLGLSGLAHLFPTMAELGRSCTHPDYRSGAVIMLLWSGIANLMRQHGFRYVLGCASVSLRDDGVTAAEVWRVASKALATQPELYKVQPRHRYPVERLNSVLPARIPPL